MEREVVITLTTVPSRLSDVVYGENNIKACIKSLQNQEYENYKVHFNIPYVCAYSGEEYVIPEWLADYDKIEIFRMEDLGPATKIIPTLQRINSPETIIIVVDDDLVYHPCMVREHAKHQANEDCAFGYDSLDTYTPMFGDMRDHFVSSLPYPLRLRGKIMQHYKSVSYKRKYFQDDFFTDFVGKTKSDDILLAAYMNKQGIEKWVMSYEHEEKLETYADWQARGGVCTFPVIKHTHHDPIEGCRDPRALALEVPFFIPAEFIEKQYI